MKSAIIFFTFVTIVFFAAGTVRATPKNAIVTETVPFFEEPGPGLLARGFLDKHDTCAVDSTHVDSAGAAWFHVRASSMKKADGWVNSKSVLFLSDMPVDFSSREARGDEDKKRRLEIIKTKPQWPRRIMQAIRNGRICLDMSEEQVVASWGEPAEKRKAFMIGIGDYSMFVYKNASRETLLVALRNDKVIGWTTGE